MQVIILCQGIVFFNRRKTFIYLNVICERLRHKLAVWTILELCHKRVRMMTPTPPHSLVAHLKNCFHVSVDLQASLLVNMLSWDKRLVMKCWRASPLCSVVFGQHGPHMGLL